MKINFQEIIRKNLPKNIKQPHRSQIYVGYTCHQHCGFCYYKKHYNEPMFPKNYVLRQIDLELSYGITDFEITGGEPSECKDLVFYCKYIKTKLPNAKIAVITNGNLYKIFDIWNYIDEVLISYHISKNDSYIDKHIFPLGHTYNQVKKTIDLAKKYKKIIRTNTVLGTFNIRNIDLITGDLIDFQPDIINFLPINLFDNANDMDNYINYSQMRPLLKKSINKLRLSLKNTLLFIRFMPFCDMDGYEQYIIDSWQHMFDWFDWNPELCGYYLIEYLEKYKSNDEILNYLGKFGSRSFERSYDCIKQHYEKNEKCLTCKYYIICDGVEKTITHHLLKDIVPCKGKIIKNPMFYLQNTIYDKYKAYYDN